MIILCVFSLSTQHGWAQPPETPEKSPSTSTEASDNNTSLPNDPIRLDSKAPRQRHPANTQQSMKLLADHLNNNETIEWIDSAGEPFLAVWNADRTGDAKGAVLIVHAEGEHPAWPQTTRPLHDSLPDYGWATMAIHLPNPHSKPVPKRTIATRATVNTTSDSTTPTADDKPETDTPPTPAPTPTATAATRDTEKISSERLAAALQFLHEKGQFNVILMGSGVGAIRTHLFMKSITPIITDERLRKRFEKPIQASIIFNARNRLPTENKDFSEWFFDPEIPVLDIYTTEDIRNQQAAYTRKILGKREKVVTHSQIKIATINYEKSWQENILSRRVRSFLEAYLKGIEVNRRVE